jgi:hypothetical protein
MPYNSINLLKRMRKQEIGKQLKKCKENRRIDIHFND